MAYELPPTAITVNFDQRAVCVEGPLRWDELNEARRQFVIQFREHPTLLEVSPVDWNTFLEAEQDRLRFMGPGDPRKILGMAIEIDAFRYPRSWRISKQE